MGNGSSRAHRLAVMAILLDIITFAIGIGFIFVAIGHDAGGTTECTGGALTNHLCASSTHTHNVFQGIFWQVNNTAGSCLTTTTTFKTCEELTPAAWVCQFGIGCNLGGAFMNKNSTQGFPDLLQCFFTFTYSFSAAVADTMTIQIADSPNAPLFIQPQQTTAGQVNNKSPGAINGVFLMQTAGPTANGDLILLQIHQSVNSGVTATVFPSQFYCIDMNYNLQSGPPVPGT